MTGSRVKVPTGGGGGGDLGLEKEKQGAAGRKRAGAQTRT